MQGVWARVHGRFRKNMAEHGWSLKAEAIPGAVPLGTGAVIPGRYHDFEESITHVDQKRHSMYTDFLDAP